MTAWGCRASNSSPIRCSASSRSPRFLGAVVRGFSGFGSGLIFMPVAAACLGPKPAAGVLFVIDTILIVPFVVRALRIVEWREVLPMGLGAMLMVPARRGGALHARPGARSAGALSLAILVSVGAARRGLALSRADARLALAPWSARSPAS